MRKPWVYLIRKTWNYWLYIWYIYTNICIQEYVSKPRNDHHYLMTKVAKALNILSNSDDRSWTTLRLITKICWMIMVTEIFYKTTSIITKISPLSCKSFWSSALGQIDHRQVGVLKIMIIIKYNDNDYMIMMMRNLDVRYLLPEAN